MTLSQLSFNHTLGVGGSFALGWLSLGTVAIFYLHVIRLDHYARGKVHQELLRNVSVLCNNTEDSEDLRNELKIQK